MTASSYPSYEIPRGNLEQVRETASRNLNTIASWGVTKNTMQDGDFFCIPLLHQMIVYALLSIETGGTLEIGGEVIIIDD